MSSKSNDKTTPDTKKIQFQVSTSDREKELTKEKETLIMEKAKLEKELNGIKKNYDDKVAELAKATEDLDDTAKKRDDYAQKFTELAMKRYEAEKKAILGRAKDVLDDETFKDMETKIDSPEKLDQMRYTLDTIVSQLEKKGQSTEGEESKPPETPPTPTANPSEKGSGGIGSATIKEKPTGTSSDLLKREFANPKEMIDYLYDRVARGKTVARTVKDPKTGKTITVEDRTGPDVEAEKIVNELWLKFRETQKGISASHNTYTMCWKCKGMYDVGLGTCPLCGVSLTSGPVSHEGWRLARAT